MNSVSRCNQTDQDLDQIDQVDRDQLAAEKLPAPRIEIVRREDGRFGWLLVAATGVVIARDAGPGFAKRSQAEGVVERVTRGEFADSPLVVTDGEST